MKVISKRLLVLLGLTYSIASAESLGEANDTYVGVQITMPLASKSMSIFSGHNRYRYLLIQQRDGIKDGIAVTQDNNGNQILNYLRPLARFDISDSRISEYAVPILRLDAQTSDENRNSTNYAGVGLAAILVVGMIVKHDLEKSWKKVE